MSDTSSVTGKVGAESCIRREEGYHELGEGFGSPTWESGFPDKGDRTDLWLEVGETKRQSGGVLVLGTHGTVTVMQTSEGWAL